MLRITQSESAAAARNYFEQSLARGDYYLEGQEIAGSWGGRGAELLGMHGAVEKEAFMRLLENQRPDGEQLTARKTANRRPGYDFTFDVPKSVSLLHLLSGDERIVDAMRRAVAETMRELESEMHARVRKRGAFEDRKTGNAIWADFVHFTARPTPLPPEVAAAYLKANPWLKRFCDDKGNLIIPDPHLHTHVYVMNATFDEVENIWKAGEFMRLKRDASYYQAAYHVRLAAELQKLGHDIEATANAFEIAGVPRSVVEAFSRRTKEIEEAAKRLGLLDAKSKDALGALTRRKKVPEVGTHQLKQVWRSLLRPATLAKLDGIVARARSMKDAKAIDDPTAASEGIRSALGHELERASTVPERRLMAQALMRSVGRTSVETLRGLLRVFPQVIFGAVAGEKLVTTPEILAEETALFEMVREGRGQCRPLISGHYEFQSAALKELKDSTREQRAAVEHLLRATDKILGLVGRAGTGKTTLLSEFDAALRSVGKRMVLCAPTAEASRGVLRAEGFADADTVKKLLADLRLNEQLRGAVLWVDEAGMLGNRDMLALLQLAKERGAERVVLAGDAKQIRSVPRGDAFLFLEKNAGLDVARLTTVRRQTNARLRQAVEAISAGEVAEGFQILVEENCITEGGVQENAASLAKLYAEKTRELNKHGKPKTALVISPTHAEGERLTGAIRGELRASGALKSEDREVIRTVSLSWTQQQREHAASYEPGLLLQFKQNVSGFRKSERVRVSSVDARAGQVKVWTNEGKEAVLPMREAEHWQVYAMRKIPVAVGDALRITENGFDETGKYRLNNGDMVKVAGFTKNGGIRLENERVLPRDFGHLNHGYVITADAAQAKTVDAVFLSISQESFGATDIRRFYVMLSRARSEAYIFTDDQEALLRAAQNDADRMTATELVRQKTPCPVLRQPERLPPGHQFPTMAPLPRAPLPEPPAPRREAPAFEL